MDAECPNSLAGVPEDIFDAAVKVMGSRADAVRWLQGRAIGLDGRVPAEVLRTPDGVKLVRNFLGRLEFGVYT